MKRFYSLSLLVVTLLFASCALHQYPMSFYINARPQHNTVQSSRTTLVRLSNRNNYLPVNLLSDTIKSIRAQPASSRLHPLHVNAKQFHVIPPDTVRLDTVFITAQPKAKVYMPPGAKLVMWGCLAAIVGGDIAAQAVPEAALVSVAGIVALVLTAVYVAVMRHRAVAEGTFAPNKKPFWDTEMIVMVSIVGLLALLYFAFLYSAVFIL